MSLINIISAIGDNNSKYPLAVRDLGIENVVKVALSAKQNKEDKFIQKQSIRETAIREYGTSFVWLWGIPIVEKAADFIIKKLGFATDISPELLNNKGIQSLENNIKKFKDITPEKVKELEKINKNLGYYNFLQKTKFLAATAIPIAVMGFILPKLNFGITQKKFDERRENNNKSLNFLNMDEYIKKTKKENLTFKGLNLTEQQKMMILDGGLTVGRVKTARNIPEKKEMLIYMIGASLINYVFPDYIAKGLDKLTKKIFKVNTELDVKILYNNKFLNAIKENKLELPKVNNEEKILEFFDKNPKSIFSKIAQKQNLVSYLENGYRDPAKYVNCSKINNLIESVEKFAKDSINSGNIEKFVKKASIAKSFNILANVIISSFLLAFCLPKVQYFLRKLTTGENFDPGIKDKKLNKTVKA